MIDGNSLASFAADQIAKLVIGVALVVAALALCAGLVLGWAIS